MIPFGQRLTDIRTTRASHERAAFQASPFVKLPGGAIGHRVSECLAAEIRGTPVRSASTALLGAGRAKRA